GDADPRRPRPGRRAARDRLPLGARRAVRAAGSAGGPRRSARPVRGRGHPPEPRPSSARGDRRRRGSTSRRSPTRAAVGARRLRARVPRRLRRVVRGRVVLGDRREPGRSRAGADGGGIVVFLAAFAVLASRLYRMRWTWRRAAAAAVGGAAAVAALVGIDAATGGSSHVTHAFRRGPVSLAEDLWVRIHISAASLGSSAVQATVFAVSIAALV